jgi:hypothetical protein
MNTERRHMRRLRIDTVHKAADRHPRPGQRRKFAKRRLGVELGAAAATAAVAVLLWQSADRPKSDKSSEPVRPPTTPVTLVNELDLFAFVAPDSRNPQAGGLRKLKPESVDKLKKEGFDSQKAQIVKGRTNTGPDRKVEPGEDPNGTETYYEVLLPDGSTVHVASSNIQNPQALTQE